MENKNKDKRVPKLRFKDFTDDWEQRKLGEISKYIKGYAFKSKDYCSNGIQLLRVSDLTDANKKREKIFLPESYKEKYSKYLIKNYDIVITTVGSKSYQQNSAVGKVYLIRNKNIQLLNQNLVKLKSVQDNVFLYSNLSKKKYTSFIAGIERGNANQANIAVRDLLQYKIFIPNKKEQKKLSKVILILQNILDLQQRKIFEFKLLKTFLLQNEFPLHEKDKANISFKNSNEKWKVMQNSKIFKVISKKGFSNFTVLSATQDKGMVPREKLNSDIKYQKKSLNNYKLVRKGDFVAHLRSFQGGFAYSSFKGIASPAYTVFCFKDPHQEDSNFWKEKFRSYNFIQLLKKVTYGVRDGRSINFKDFLQLKDKEPSLKIQKNIGKNLFQIKKITTLDQKKLKQLQQIKQFLLQNMFI